MNTYLEEILYEIGWSDGFHVPLANTENQILEVQYEQLITRRNTSVGLLTALNERIDSLEHHLRNILQQQRNGQTLLTAHNTQLAIEYHLKKTQYAEEENLKHNMQQFEKGIINIQDRHLRIQTDVSRIVSRIDSLKNNVALDSDVLRMWELAQIQSQEDNNIIQMFSLEDETKARDLELKRQNIREEVYNRKQTVLKMVAEVTSFEQVLERTAQLYKETMNERQQLIEQWRKTVKHLCQRDNDIQNSTEEIEILKNAVKANLDELEEQKLFYNNEVSNNKEIENVIDQLNNECSQARDNLNHLIRLIQQYNSELSIQKRELSSVSNQLENERKHGKQLFQEMTNKKLLSKNSLSQNKMLKIKLEDIINKTMTSSERTKQLEEIVQSKEKKIRILQQEISRMQEIIFRSQQTFLPLVETEKITTLDIKRYETAIEILQKEERKNDLEIQKQKEIEYSLDFRVAMLESKISALQGEMHSAEEKDIFATKIKTLSETLEEKNQIQSLFQIQVNSLEDEMRRLTNTIGLNSSELICLKSKLQDQFLLVEGGKKQVKANKMQTQQNQVEENVLRLRVKQSQKLLQKQGNQLFSLEKNKLEFEAAMKERQLEINIEKDILSIKKRSLLEDKGKLRSEVQERKSRLEQHKNKYDIAVGLLGKGEDGEPLSVTHFKIKNAQEKCMLQQEGDALDAKIRKAEKEIIAMENTLKVVNTTNDTYKRNLSTVEEDDPEAQQMKQLEDEYYKLFTKLREYKNENEKKHTVLFNAKTLLQKLSLDSQEAITLNKFYENEIMDIHKTLEEQMEKFQRADKQLVKFIKQIRQKGYYGTEEKDITLREIIERNEYVLQQLAELATNHIETSPTINRYLVEYSLTLPASLLKSKSSLSVRSSVTSSSGHSAKSSGSRLSDVSSSSIIPQTINLNFDVSSKNSKENENKQWYTKKKSKK